MTTSYQDKPIPVQAWLQSLSLTSYLPFFFKYSDVRELFDVTDDEVLALGIQNVADRQQIITSLKLLAAKLQSNSAEGRPCTPPPNSSDATKLADELRLLPDLRGVAWFHGKIGREEAERLVAHPEEFLVRESISQSGSYVLTCNHQGQARHFVINKFIEPGVRGTIKSVEFGFESQKYISIQALILAHVADGSEITASSGAKIKIPVNRTGPLTAAPSGGSTGLTKSASNDFNLYEATSAPPSSLQSAGKVVSPHLLLKQEEYSIQRVNSEPKLNKENHLPSTVKAGRFNTRGGQTSASSLAVPTSMVNARTKSEGHLNVTLSHLPNRSADLKVSRGAAMRTQPLIQIRNREHYDEGADYSDYYEVKRMPGEQPTATNTSNQNTSSQSNTALQNHSHNNLLNQSNFSHLNGSTQSNDSSPQMQSSVSHSEPEKPGEEDYDVPVSEVREIYEFTTPIIPTNYIDAYNFQSTLLSNENKPLDPNCMYKLKEVLFQGNHMQISQHITYLDLHLFKVIETRNLGAGIFSGIEALTLPQGRHFRQAAIERHYSLSFLVSVTILACTDDLMERSQMVKQWILIAKDLLRIHGNLLSFAAIMHGLIVHPIQRLKMTWNILERSEPVLLNHWRTQLRPAYKGLTDSTNSLSSDNVCIPYITPICELMEVTFLPPQAMEHDHLVQSLAQMDSARLMAGQTASYSQRGSKMLRFFRLKAEIVDLCKVELHMRLLFGHQGARAKHSERRVKFQQILKILSERAENNDLGTEF